MNLKNVHSNIYIIEVTQPPRIFTLFTWLLQRAFFKLVRLNILWNILLTILLKLSIFDEYLFYLFHIDIYFT